MALKIKQENYTKPPSAEQRKVFLEAWAGAEDPIPATRIEAHLKIRGVLKDIERGPVRRRQVRAWQAARKVKRIQRAQEAARRGNTTNA